MKPKLTYIVNKEGENVFLNEGKVSSGNISKSVLFGKLYEEKNPNEYVTADSFVNSVEGEYALIRKTNDYVEVMKDASGEKNIYFAEHPQKGLIISSEIKGILESGFSASPNGHELRKILCYRSPGESDTCFKGIKRLNKDEKIIYDLNSNELSVVKGYLCEAKPQESLDELITKTITNRFTHGKKGLMLSSGLDSTLILAYLKELYGDDVSAFTSYYDYSTDELEGARAIASEMGVDFSKLKISPLELKSCMGAVVRSLEEPKANPSYLSLYNIAKRARGVTSLWTGDGADELFAGYDKHINILKALNENKFDIQTYIKSRMPFEEKLLGKLNALEPLNEIVETFVKRVDLSDPERAMDLLMETDDRLMLPDNNFSKITQDLGIKMESPLFFSRGISSFAKNTPMNEKLNGKVTKKILRDLSREKIGSEKVHSIIHQPKKIFYTPLQLWIDNDKEVENVLKKSEYLSEVVDMDGLRKIYPEMNSYQKWTLLFIDEWFKAFF